MIRASARLLSLSLSLAAIACSSSPQGLPRSVDSSARSQPNPFPTRGALTRLAAVPVPARLFEDAGKDVPTWDLSGPLPDALEEVAHQASSPWEQLLTDAAAAWPGRPLVTEAMSCVARQNAAFYLENESLPAEPLEQFIAARCGAPTSNVGVGFQGAQVDDRISDERIFAEFPADGKKRIQALVQTGDRYAGIFFARKHGRVVIAMASSPRKVFLQKTPLVPDAEGKVVVRGELLQAAASVRAVINRGRFGYQACSPDPSVRLPQFAFTCAALREDEAAWLEVAMFPPGRIIGSSAFDVLVWPSGAPGKTYAKLTRSKDAGAPDTGASFGGMVQELNDIRRQAGLPLLRLAEQESQTAAQLAPHYFAAIGGAADDAVADQVALGLRAGWDVRGTVRYGTFISNWVQNAAGYGDVLRAALSRPFGREALLDPAAEQVAIGTVAVEKGQVLGAMFSTYALFDTYRHDNDIGIVIAQLTAQRAARRQRAPVPLPGVVSTDAARAAQSVQIGLKQPHEAMQLLLQSATERLGQDVQGWTLEASKLEDLKFPEEMLARPALSLAIAVAHYRRIDEPWGRFLMFFVAPANAAPALTAQASAKEGGGGRQTARFFAGRHGGR
jgi:hypothetical protein